MYPFVILLKSIQQHFHKLWFLLHLYTHLNATTVNQLIDWLTTIKLFANYFDHIVGLGHFFKGKMLMFLDSSLSLDIFVFQPTECL